MRPLARGIYALFALAFAASALVQVNDPDPLPWIGIYATAATLAVLAMLGRPASWQTAATGGLAVLWALTLSPSLPRIREPAVREWSMPRGEVDAEEARECSGLILVAASCFLIFLDANATRRRSLSDDPAAATPQRTA